MNKLARSVSWVTDRGMSRRENQDSYFVSPDQRLLVVADGMGGVKGGAEASRLAVEAIQLLWTDKPPHLDDHDQIQQWLQEAAEKANASVCDAADVKNVHPRMGTTVVVAVQADGDRLHIAHVGDSRAYSIKQGAIASLTGDHSMVYEMMIQGKLTLKECQESPFRSVLTRCLGHDRNVAIDKTVVDLHAGEWIVICSDGLCGYLTDEQIAQVLADCRTAEEGCSKLLSSTMEVGAPDNVTIIAVQYSGEVSDVTTVTEATCSTSETVSQTRA